MSIGAKAMRLNYFFYTENSSIIKKVLIDRVNDVMENICKNYSNSLDSPVFEIMKSAIKLGLGILNTVMGLMKGNTVMGKEAWNSYVWRAAWSYDDILYNWLIWRVLKLAFFSKKYFPCIYFGVWSSQNNAIFI